MRQAAYDFINAVDSLIAFCRARWVQPKGILLPLLVHSVFTSRQEPNIGAMDTQQGFTVEDLDDLLGWLKDRSFTFLLARDVMPKRLRLDANYAVLTFDDGYANNLHAVDILRRHGAKATLYVSTANITSGKAFWWDVVYRELHHRGFNDHVIRREQSRVKRLHFREIEQFITREFGREARDPVADHDRPLTSAELKKISALPNWEIGNHTRDHAILTNCSMDDARAQIEGCQEDVEAITGSRPNSIAYPNGDFSPSVIALAAEMKFSTGITTVQKALQLHPDTTETTLLMLPRITLLSARRAQRQITTGLAGAPLTSATRWLREVFHTKSLGN
jgi:peptidoglycan/xylan/chitin deacetylase (PgdA/CDA1 family)